MYNQVRAYQPYHSPYDPCPPIGLKYYVLPPNQFIPFQPYGLPQYKPREALYRGTLWPALYSYYQNPYEKGRD
jgi:spore coat protein JA